MTPARNERLARAAERLAEARERHPRALLLVEIWRRSFRLGGRLVDAAAPHVASAVDAATDELDRRGAQRRAERLAQRRNSR